MSTHVLNYKNKTLIKCLVPFHVHMCSKSNRYDFVSEEKFGYVKGRCDNKSSLECNDSETDMALQTLHIKRNFH
jgi:hypothetical protein